MEMENLMREVEVGGERVDEEERGGGMERVLNMVVMRVGE